MKWDLSQLEIIAEGKTKTVYAHPENPQLSLLYFKDDITAGDGAKHDVMKGKGAINCETSSLVMRCLNRHGVPTHFVEQIDENTQLVRKVDMIPLECISRQIAYGSLVRRFPFFKKGEQLPYVTFETHFKNDAEHDPPINKSLAVAGGLLTNEQYKIIHGITIKAFKILRDAFENVGATLVDYKVEFGITSDGQIVLADELTNDSWRVWPGGIEEHMIDKQVYRDTGDVKKAKVGYEQMLELVRRF